MKEPQNPQTPGKMAVKLAEYYLRTLSGAYWNDQERARIGTPKILPDWVGPDLAAIREFVSQRGEKLDAPDNIFEECRIDMVPLVERKCLEWALTVAGGLDYLAKNHDFVRSGSYHAWFRTIHQSAREVRAATGIDNPIREI